MEKYYLWLLLVYGEGEPEINSLLKNFGTPEGVYNAFQENKALAGFRNTIRAAEVKLERAEALLGELTGKGIAVITRDDPLYPAALKETVNPPCVLFAKGNTPLLKKKLVTTVGSRSVTDYTQSIIPNIMSAFKNMYVPVGTLSEGCDQLIALDAVSCGTGFIEVMPCGFDSVYPGGSKTLRRWLLANGGLLVSEFLSKEKALNANFHKRSRILGGMTEVTLVVQGGRKSGTLLTAEYSWAPLFVPPNNVMNEKYAGAAVAVREGAKLYMDINDIRLAFERSEELHRKALETGTIPSPHYKFHKEPENVASPAKSTPQEIQAAGNNSAEAAAGVNPSNKNNVPTENKVSDSPKSPEKRTSPSALSHSAGKKKKPNNISPAPDSFETEEQRQVYEVLRKASGALSPEELIAETGLDTAALAEALLDLEIEGYIVSAMNRYSVK